MTAKERARSYGTLLFFHQPHIRNLHLFVNRFAHVVNREERYGDARKRFHLHPGLRSGARAAGCADCVALHFEIDFDVAQRQGMTQGNQFRSSFGGLNSGDLRRCKNIPLPDPIARDRIGSRPLDFDFSRRNGYAQTLWLGRNINHPHPPVGADVIETLHAFITPLLQHSITSAADRDHFAVRLVILPEIMLLRFSLDYFKEKLP
jgi:hypothetical protein